MYDLKPISIDAIPKAPQKAERYRLLNEPRKAESICRDVPAIEPDNQDAAVTLLLALTDQFGRDVPGYVVFQWLRRAMDFYERAQGLAEPGDEDATLRWSTCARMINQDVAIRPRAEDAEVRAGFEVEVPFR